MIEVELPDGRMLEVNTDDPAKAAQAAKKYLSAPPSQPRASIPGGQAVGASTQGILDTMSFGFGDEIMAGALAPVEAAKRAITGEDEGKGFTRRISDAYSSNLDRERSSLEAAQNEHPVAFTTGQVAGGLTAGAKAAQGGLSLLQGAKPTMMSMAPRAAGEGAIYGGLYGVGSGEGLRDRAIEGAIGAGTGGVIGGLGGAISARGAARAARKAVPGTQALREQKRAAYGAVDAVAGKYKPTAFNGLVDDIQSEMSRLNLNPMRHPKAASMLDDLSGLKGRAPTLTELDQIRQVVRRDIVNQPDGAERFFGNKIIEKIDDFIANTPPSSVSGGNARELSETILRARDLNTRFRKSELVDQAMEKALRRAASSGTGGNTDNAIRQAIRSILDNPKSVQGFTEAEKAALERVVWGSKGQNLLRLLGRLSPHGNALMAFLGIGATAANPLLAAVPATGFVAKQLADRATPANVALAQALIRNGGQIPPKMTGVNRAILEALMRSAPQQAQSALSP